jgi:hypothetical protein
MLSTYSRCGASKESLFSLAGACLDRGKSEEHHAMTPADVLAAFHVALMEPHDSLSPEGFQLHRDTYVGLQTLLS